MCPGCLVNRKLMLYINGGMLSTQSLKNMWFSPSFYVGIVDMGPILLN